MEKNNNVGIQGMFQRSRLSMKMLFVLLFVSIGLQSYSQSGPLFSGEDRHVFFDKNVGAVDVKLGKTDTNNDVYYRWELYSQPANGMYSINNNLLPNPTVYIYAPGEYIFQCTKVSKFGRKKEYVVVNATSKVEILDVKAKQSKCFIHGTTITKEDFDIITQPEDCEEYVVFKEGADVLNGKIKTVWPIYVHEVVFLAQDEDGEYYESEVKCKIPVINDFKTVYYKELQDYSGETVPLDVEENVDMVQDVLGGMNRIHCFSDPAYILPPGLYQMVNPGSTANTAISGGIIALNAVKTMADFITPASSFIPSFSYSSELEKLGCRLKCDAGEVYPEIYFNGKVSASLSFGIDVGPVPSIIPGVGLYLSGSSGLDLLISKTDGEPLNPKGKNLKIPITFTRFGFIGATVGFIKPSVLAATVGLQLNTNIDSHLNFNSMLRADEEICPDCWTLSENGVEFDNFYMNLNVKATVTAMSFQSTVYDIKIWEIFNLNQVLGD